VREEEEGSGAAVGSVVVEDSEEVGSGGVLGGVDLVVGLEVAKELQSSQSLTCKTVVQPLQAASAWQ
jgi:hypothetical protein